eukprot:3029994-Amphidinium_carterae.1
MTTSKTPAVMACTLTASLHKTDSLEGFPATYLHVSCGDTQANPVTLAKANAAKHQHCIVGKSKAGSSDMVL